MPFSIRVEVFDDERGVRAKCVGARAAFDFGVAFNLRQSTLLRLLDDLDARDDLDAGAQRCGDAAILRLREFDGPRHCLRRDAVAANDVAQLHARERARVLRSSLATNLDAVVRDALALLTQNRD